MNKPGKLSGNLRKDIALEAKRPVGAARLRLATVGVGDDWPHERGA